MATLYELTAAAAQLYELLQNEEIDEQTLTDTLEAMGGDEKLENYCKIIKQLQADADMFKAEAARIAAKKKTVENSIDRMKTAVKGYLNAKGQTKAKAGTFSVSLAKTKAVQIDDAEKLPEQYLIEQPPKIDKLAIKDALKNGYAVDGASLIENEGVRIK